MLALGISDIGPVGVVHNCFRLLTVDIGILPDGLWLSHGKRCGPESDPNRAVIIFNCADIW